MQLLPNIMMQDADMSLEGEGSAMGIIDVARADQA